jgi:ABC-type multidrug transport system ATPase subunit
VIRASKVKVVLGGRPILGGVDLVVAPGESVALVGPNGAGKTTLLRCVLGLVQYEGRIELGGIDPVRDPVRARSLVGYMPQVSAFAEESARGALALVAALRGAPTTDIERLLIRVGLAEHGARDVRSFSTGMRQRLSLAAALIGSPKILLLDEPTASLDLRGQTEVVALVHRLQADGTTILMSSHRADEVRALAHRVVLLDDGHVVASGTIDAVESMAWGEPSAATRPLRVVS